ncbi:MAG: hypothetical protein RIE77_10330 [Phycisphaerales bacterium]
MREPRPKPGPIAATVGHAAGDGTGHRRSTVHAGQGPTRRAAAERAAGQACDARAAGPVRGAPRRTGGLEWIAYQVATRLTTSVVSDWSDEKTFNFGTIGNQNPASTSAPTSSGPDGGETLTIEDAQQLKDAQTAKGADKAG